MRVGRICLLSAALVLLSLSLLAEPRKLRSKYPEFEKLFQEMWTLDANRLEVGKDLILNPQAIMTPPFDDESPDPLFTFVNGTRLANAPTYLAFIKLLPFYEPDILINESNSAAKTQSQMDFLDAVMATPVMATVRRYLEKKKLASPDDEDFREMLGHLWFTDFPRKMRLSSSPFEHVFLGEGRGKRTFGLHYWLPLYLHERDGSLNYYGFHGKRRGGLANILTVAFKWREEWMKEYATFLFGTSPEFDMGLYTAAYLTIRSLWPEAFRGAVSLRSQNTKLAIQCYSKEKVLLGSCYVV